MSEVKEQGTRLQFTGNWLIDAGILGFVNLMEDVYGWDLEELQKRIRENEEKIYYGYFPFAYLFYYSKIPPMNKKINNLRKKKSVLYKLIEEKNILNKIKEPTLKAQDKKIRNKENKIEEIKNEILELDKEIDKINKNLICERQQFNAKINAEISNVLTCPENHFVNRKKQIENLIENFELQLPQRNFFLVNPKKPLWFSFVYIFAILKNDVDRIKTLRITKEENKLIKWLDFCSRHSYQPDDLINTIEKNILNGNNKNYVINELIKNCNNSCKTEHGKICEGIFKNIKKEAGDIVAYEERPDSTINPFSYSPEEFSNIGYTNVPSIKELQRIFFPRIPFYTVFFSFMHAFQFIQGRNLSFYSNSLPYTYAIHKRIKEKIGSINKKGRNIFEITFRAIIDELIEKQSLHSLESLYVIEYGGFSNQKIQNVEYLSISKLNAILLLDDIIRENLNKAIPCNENRKDDGYVWLTEQLLNERPLTPLIIEHVERFIKKDVYLSLIPSLYALMINANKQKLSTKESHFNYDFFKGYPDLVDGIKRDVNYIRYVHDAFSKCIIDENDQDLYMLLSAIKGNNRNQYLNLLYRILVKSEEELDKKMVSDYAFKNIIKNKNTWTYYGLALMLKALIQWKKKQTSIK